MKYFTFVMLWLSFGFPTSAQSLKSPDRKFVMEFRLNQGIPSYNLKYNHEIAIEDSKLGLRLFNTTGAIPSLSEITDTSFDLNKGFTAVGKKGILRMRYGSLYWA